MFGIVSVNIRVFLCLNINVIWEYVSFNIDYISFNLAFQLFTSEQSVLTRFQTKQYSGLYGPFLFHSKPQKCTFSLTLNYFTNHRG
jgi:hypothetical protein